MRADNFKSRAKHREDMFLRRLFAMHGKMAKANAAWDKIRKNRSI